MENVFTAVQTNGITLRAEIKKTGRSFSSPLVLWVAEGKEEIYVSQFINVLGIESYTPDSTKPSDTTVILLLKNDDEVSTLQVGSFEEKDNESFISWVRWRLSKIYD